MKERNELFNRTKADIASRLRSACNHVPADEFERLIARMATVRLKYSQRRDMVLFAAFETT